MVLACYSAHISTSICSVAVEGCGSHTSVSGVSWCDGLYYLHCNALVIDMFYNMIAN